MAVALGVIAPVAWARPDAAPVERLTDDVEVTVDVVEGEWLVDVVLWLELLCDVDVGVS